MAAFLSHLSLIVALWLHAPARSSVEGALDFKILFKDPKSVVTKVEVPRSCSAAVRCVPIDADTKGDMLKSQDKEDYCLLKYFFPGVCEGKYLEVGAGDGMKFSNSYIFHHSTDLGWKGVNVELNPDSYERLVSNRRNDLANIHAAVCSDTDKPVHYAHDSNNNAVGGIWEFTNEKYREKFWPGITLFNTIEVPCTPLQSILDQTLGKNNQHYFDFATIDIEGAELSALLGIDWSRTKFGILIVEKNQNDEINQMMHELLQSKGYSLMSNDMDHPECGARNWFYKNGDFEQIYSRLRAPMGSNNVQPGGD
jgi:FkbM family methyltransferase